MNKALILILILLNLVASANAQQTTMQKEELPFPGQLMRRVPENNYLGPFVSLKSLEQAYLASAQWSDMYLDIMAYSQADVGLYAEAIAYLDKREKKSELKNLTTSPLDSYRPVKALDAIASVAEKEQVIMINEYHHVPMHRAFTTELLPVLYKKGFRYLALEALNEADTELNTRRYASYKSGTSEPVFGEMIRYALALGYKVIPYEYRGDCKPPQNCQNERERGQAQNIYDRILKNDPNAKILVHAGMGHIQEREGKSTTIMAAHFKNISKINPFTIDQIEMIEHSAPEYEEIDYRYATRKNLIKQPTLFQSTQGDFWKSKTGQFGTVDAQIFHPRVVYKHGRPDWLKTDGLRKTYAIDAKKLNLPTQQQKFTGQEFLLLQAIASKEGESSVPVDQILLSPNQQLPVLMLPKGDYRIQVIDKAGKTLGQYNQAVK